jgi:outer membrane protein TolC
VAFAKRLDLRVTVGKVYDAQRTVAVAADQLRADVTLLGSGAAGAQRTLASVRQDDAILRPDEGTYSVLLTLDLPFERTAERATYRSSLIGFEQAVRRVQELEDRIKLDVRNGLSRLLEGRETIRIQAQAVNVARRRVDSTSEFLEAGRAEIRDVLEAQDALVTAQNALTSALVNYRVNELSLQRDLGALIVDHRGLWHEYEPEKADD